jgi:hypothetical protein
MILEMLSDHWFWGTTALAVLGWYSTVTIYVAIRGALDIRQMLRDLAARPSQDAQRRSPRQP